MPELRQDPFTHDWVIYARERSKRPEDFNRRAPGPLLPEYSEYCPFCPGNEHMTPGALALYGQEGAWRTRVVPNKFAALKAEGDTSRKGTPFFRWMDGYGRHEVIIETPLHNLLIPFMDQEGVEEVLRAYRDRYRELRKDPDVKTIIIFKNHGKGAGTSLQHPHTQIVAAPIVSPYVRRKYEVATQYYDDVGHCLYCDVLLEELKDGRRIVMQTYSLAAFHPYASHFPFETWIMPLRHESSFGNVSDQEIKELAVLMKGILLKLYKGLGNPDYNLIIHTSPVDDEHKSYYTWHMQIVPRLAYLAGFELGSGIMINITMPEETAKHMRDISV